MSNITVTGQSGQKMLRLISAAKRHLNSRHTRAPAFSVGGSVITEWAFITGRINNALAFAVRSLLLSLCWWIVSLGRFSNVTVIYDNMMCLERSGSKLFAEGGRTGCHEGEQQAITLPFSLDFGYRAHPWILDQPSLFFIFWFPQQLWLFKFLWIVRYVRAKKNLFCIDIYRRGKNWSRALVVIYILEPDGSNTFLLLELLVV